MNENNISRRSFIKTIFLGGFGLIVSIFGFKSKKDNIKNLNDNLPKDSIFRSRDQI